MIADIDAITSQYWKSHWTLPGEPYEIDNSNITVKLVDFNYDPVDPVTVPDLIASSIFINDTDVADSQTFSDTKTRQASFRWSLSEGLKLGAKASFKVGVPVIADGKVEASIELSLSATQEQSTTVTQSWSYSATVPVPAHSVVVASASVSTAQYNTKYRARLSVDGTSICHVKGNDRKGILTAVGEILKSVPGFTQEKNALPVSYTASGTFTGIQGISILVKTKQSKYRPKSSLITTLE